MQNKIKIFDICGTLYHSNTTVDFCVWMEPNAAKKILLKVSTSLIGRAFNKLTGKLFRYDFIRDLHIRTLKNKDLEFIENKANSFVELVLEEKKIKQIHKIMKEHNTDDIILASASIEPVVKAIAKKLNIKNYHASSLLHNGVVYNGKLGNDLSGKKHHLFSNQDIDLVVTDNLDDYKLCLLSNKFVIVSKTKHLKIWKSRDLSKMIQLVEV